jgi:patatin-related protein
MTEGKSVVEVSAQSVGILAYGSLLSEPGAELSAHVISRIPVETPWPVEYARSSERRGGGPTLVIHNAGKPVKGEILVLDFKGREIEKARELLARREETPIANIKTTKAGGFDAVLYADLPQNIEDAKLTPDNLASLAINSVVQKPDRNGIRYLAENTKRGIITNLSEPYERAILARLKAKDLESAEHIALASAGKPVDGSRHSNVQKGDYRQEVRFAVVMYGGVSLAIYIHGVAQELLRLVRATSLPEQELQSDPVAQKYREISPLVRDKNGTPCPTRFVIDILSGTSAGGINAIFLAKAIAIHSKDLELLRETWLAVADMEQLLNTKTPFGAKRSLLRGDWMYTELHQAFKAMNAEERKDDPASSYRPERLDLFVTTTDLNGATIPIRLADMDVLEKVHKGSFQFCFDDSKLTSAPVDKELGDPQFACDDFRPDFDPMLAFAARCTSSFPVAFAPMKLIDIKSEIGERTYEERQDLYESFFRWVPPKDLYPQGCKDIDRRELADGGYLDNKPFGHAIDAMTFRATQLPHRRKLLYVDPFPEVAVDEECRPHFDFIQNGLAAASTLPRYQTIREAVARVESSNLTQERLLRLREMVDRNIPKEKRTTFNKTFITAERDKKFENTKVAELVGQLGAIYATYHEVRLLDVTDDLAHIISVSHETAESQDFFLAIRYLVRAWRSNNYQPNGEEGKRFENEFFTEFDYSFRLRRASQLLEWAQEHFPNACNSLIQQVTRLLRMRQRLSLTDENLNPVWKEILKATDLGWTNVKAILEPITDDARSAMARRLYEAHKQSLNAIAQSIREQWKLVFDLNRKELSTFLDANGDFREQYELFDFDDMTSLAFLEGSNVSEHTLTEVYRISPVDGIDRPLEKKLAGYALADFGAFLEADWRRNDMFWGRLDASERIVSALLNDPADRPCRDRFIQNLREEIVKQEADRWSRLEPAVQASKKGNLAQYLKDKYTVPDPPPAAQSATQLGEALDILVVMLKEDVGFENGVTDKLRTLARAAVGVIAFLTPGGLPRVFLNYWLELLGVMSVLVFLAGQLVKNDELKHLGLYGLGGAVLLAFFAWLLGSLLSRRSSDPKGLATYVAGAIKWLLALALALLMLLGCWHFPEDWKALWSRIFTN